MSGSMMKLWSCRAKSSPSQGHVRVFVGKDMQFKFEMEANYLNHPLFHNSEEEWSPQTFPVGKKRKI
ncbi:hypothetical protein Ddye_007559 [Dipteronia dyeriana]|uniref:Uncharacterized protein n=1 Tax=Dipteronia dyeriana TaxID=168575 RepID=A0AAD9XKM6_9ROSI|nr:hypothetical protein Ddye_007559 [Dipteronia dyeriana]